VLDAIEAFLLDGGDQFAIDEQRSRRLVKHRVDSEDVDHPAPLPVALFLSAPNLELWWEEIMAPGKCNGACRQKYS
jgi:hypothetical protein